MPEADNWRRETEKRGGRRNGRRGRRVLNTICGAFDAMSSCGSGTDGQREDGRQVKKCPCPCCCLFQQHRLTNCPRTNRDKRIEEKRGNYKGQIELEVSYSASECELRTARGASESASSSSLLVAVSIILHLIRHDDDDDDNAAMAFFSLPFSDRNLARVPPSPSLHCRCSRPRSLARFVLFSRLDGQD